jgi:hypothetical protein
LISTPLPDLSRVNLDGGNDSPHHLDRFRAFGLVHGQG